MVMGSDKKSEKGVEEGADKGLGVVRLDDAELEGVAGGLLGEDKSFKENYNYDNLPDYRRDRMTSVAK